VFAEQKGYKMSIDERLGRDKIDPELHDKIMSALRTSKAFVWREKYIVIFQNILLTIIVGSVLTILLDLFSEEFPDHTLLVATIILITAICVFVAGSALMPTLLFSGGHLSFSRLSEDDNERLYTSLCVPDSIRQQISDNLGVSGRVEISHQSFWLQRWIDDSKKSVKYEIHAVTIYHQDGTKTLLGTWATKEDDAFAGKTAI